jgi:hypothetical protein
MSLLLDWLENTRTQVPWVITAGTYIKRKTQFWDVCNKKNAIIVELKDSYYHKLIIELKIRTRNATTKR